MCTNIEIQKVDSMSTTQNEIQFFTLRRDSSTDSDSNVAVKSETAFTDCYSLENGGCFIKHLVKQVKCETNNSCEVDSGDPVVNVKKYNMDNEMDNKIEIIEEPWWLNRETSSGCNDIKGGDSAAVKPPRLCSEAVSTFPREDSSLVCVAASRKNTRFICRRNSSDSEQQESNLIKAPSVEKHIDLELSSEYRGEDDSYSRAFLINTSKISYKCNSCEKSFTELSSLKEHNLKHDVTKAHNYQIRKRLSELERLQSYNFTSEHQKAHEFQISENRITRLQYQNPHKCQICMKRFTHLEILERHTLMHDINSPKCLICKHGFADLESLRAHESLHESEYPHKCQICMKRFTHLKILERHVLKHDINSPKCEICKRRFIHYKGLIAHALKKHGLNLRCLICMQRFADLESLRAHESLHESEYPHKCQICEKRFPHLVGMKMHALIHKGKEHLKCKICEKRFTHLEDLKAHNLIHEGEKFLKCQISEKRLTRSSSLKILELIYEGRNAQMSNL